MMKKFTWVIALFFSFTMVSYAQTTEYESKTRDFLAQKMSQQAGDIFVLDSLVKTDGYEKEEKGMKVYVMEYDLYITALHAFWKSGNAFEGYWQSFQASRNKPANNPNSAPQFYQQNSRLKLSGNATFQKTERNVRMIDLDMSKVTKLSTASSSTTTPSTSNGMTQMQIDSARYAQGDNHDSTNTGTQKKPAKSTASKLLQNLLAPKKK